MRKDTSWTKVKISSTALMLYTTLCVVPLELWSHTYNSQLSPVGWWMHCNKEYLIGYIIKYNLCTNVHPVNYSKKKKKKICYSAIHASHINVSALQLIHDYLQRQHWHSLFGVNTWAILMIFTVSIVHDITTYTLTYTTSVQQFLLWVIYVGLLQLAPVNNAQVQQHTEQKRRARSAEGCPVYSCAHCIVNVRHSTSRDV